MSTRPFKYFLLSAFVHVLSAVLIEFDESRVFRNSIFGARSAQAPQQVVLSTFHRLPRRKTFPIVAMLVSVLATHSTTLRSSLVHIPSSKRPQKRLNISQRSPGVVEYHVLHTGFWLFSVVLGKRLAWPQHGFK